MNSVRNISEIEDFEAIAFDLNELLTQQDNQDVWQEFPATVSRYTGNIDEIVDNLNETKNGCRPGIRQQFIAFSGKKAVGMSVIRFMPEVPEAIQNSWPIVSGFVCNPYRNQGIGRLSLLTRLKTVDEQFHGNAWTQVRKPNTHSHNMVTHAGFVPVSENEESIIYAYHMDSR